jgi:hypothetical protein
MWLYSIILYAKYTFYRVSLVYAKSLLNELPVVVKMRLANKSTLRKICSWSHGSDAGPLKTTPKKQGGKENSQISLAEQQYVGKQRFL